MALGEAGSTTRLDASSSGIQRWENGKQSVEIQGIRKEKSSEKKDSVYSSTAEVQANSLCRSTVDGVETVFAEIGSNENYYLLAIYKHSANTDLLVTVAGGTSADRELLYTILRAMKFKR